MKKACMKQKVWRILGMAAMAAISLVCMAGCGPVADGPKSVEIEEDTYETGFYGSMFPYHFQCEDESYTVDDVEFRKVSHEKFTLFHADVGFYTEGTIYCIESQLKEAKKYYSDSENFNYFCQIGTPTKENEPEEVDISDIDKEMFEELLEFAEENSYDPFNAKKNKSVEKADYPMPEDDESPQLIFHKESKDGVFTSGTGQYFHIMDDKLLLVFYYDYDHGKNPKLVAVEVPKKVSDYVIEYLEEKDFL